MTLAHIRHKLKRADEHIEQLHREGEAFLGDTTQRTLVYDDLQAGKAFADVQRNRIVEPRLSILAGDVLYQVRSSLDHLICALIKRDGNSPTTSSQFPIFSHAPTDKKTKARYEGQVAGITRPEVLAAIEAHQPHKRSNPANHWLAVLREFSNTDKHRALVLAVVWPEPRIKVTVIRPHLPGDLTTVVSCTDDGTDTPLSWIDPGGDLVEVVNVERRIATYVAFSKWGDGQHPIEVVHGLRELRVCVSKVVAEFDRYLL
jgi:hypothetical protein